MQSNDLRNAGLKATLPRLKVLEVFEKSSTRHLSAEEIHRMLYDAREEICIATVYRVLAQLKAAGLGYTISCRSLTLYGYCAECGCREKPSRDRAVL